MAPSNKLDSSGEGFYGWSLGAVVLLALALRFWQLDLVASAYFDEINIPKFGWALLNGRRETPFITTHPPLPHYIFAGAIALYYQMPWVDGPWSQAWELIDPLSYRWITALAGVLTVLLAAAIARRLSNSCRVAIIAALFVAIDGALVVDSRAALNNIFLLLFGLAALLVFLRTLAAGGLTRQIWLFLLALLLACTVSVKWNGLGYWLHLSALVIVMGSMAWLDRLRRAVNPGLAELNVPTPWEFAGYFVVIPLVCYWLIWQPYLLLQNHSSFAEVHQRMHQFHTLKVDGNVHPYCSAWYQWPVQIRPMSYYFSRVVADGHTQFSVIHLLGNPILYVLSLLAVLFLTIKTVWIFFRWLVFIENSGFDWQINLSREPRKPFGFYASLIVVTGYWANFLPWSIVNRCLFSYHYEPASIYAFMALALVLSAGLAPAFKPVEKPVWQRLLLLALAIGGLLAVIAAWLYWLPVQFGIPIEPAAFYARMWLDTWI